jgi:hypothetical protein
MARERSRPQAEPMVSIGFVALIALHVETKRRSAPKEAL